MSGPRYRSAWGEDVDNLPAEVSRAEEPIRDVAVGARDTSVRESQVDASVTRPGPAAISAPSFSAALAAALEREGPPHTKWEVLARRVGVHGSLLRRMRVPGAGVTAKTMDRVAEALGWQVTITKRNV